MRIEVRGDVDARAIEQLRRCAQAGDAVAGVLCADGHVGYSQPIGGAIAYPDHISPSGVGYDIGCGNKAVRTDLLTEDVRADVPRLMDEVAARVSFGMGRKNDEPVDHPVLDQILHADFRPQRKLVHSARNQLGTVGAGNHYVDLFAGDDGHVWVGVHFGSRGFGHKTASGFLSMAQGGRFDERGSDGEMDSPPVLFHVDSEIGQSYIAAMELAGAYAYAGRDVVVDKVLEILGARSLHEVHNHHNYAWREEHHGVDCWVVRKGCTPAFPGQEGFVGASMGEDAVILRGTDAAAGAGLLHSTVHGAGRVMSRTQAAGKVGTRAECNARDCSFWVTWGQFRHERDRAGATNDRFTLCPDHPDGRMSKRRGRIRDGLIDFAAVQADLATKGIELRGGAADEAPDAYKRLDVVLQAHADTVEILHRLTPIGVAMAAADTVDPFKD
ncbi:RtcB family protein [Paraconexibacter algicola]|uniref:3'-phosphate/5'-hydroxy nucleic acid ligase n=2 Tax=Paraconexibacter algicola TaxID=2133960 RepID=A0A2T4UFX5_9ACTN|nr:RtcB family protein [Paraconexibacter algicola]